MELTGEGSALVGGGGLSSARLKINNSQITSKRSNPDSNTISKTDSNNYNTIHLPPTHNRSKNLTAQPPLN